MGARIITRLDEYGGEAVVSLHVTQLDGCTPTQARRVLSEWVEFLSSGPSPIQDLTFVSRTPKRLFAALRGQRQLRVLRVKWGDYEDLAVLSEMEHLTTLILGGASAVRTLEPLSALQSVQTLSVDSLRHAHDLDPLGEMTAVTSLDVGGDWMGLRNARIDSIAFLRRMPQLRRLLLHTVIVDDRDYTPILDLPSLTHVRVKQVRGMRPSYEDLVAATPWSESASWP